MNVLKKGIYNISLRIMYSVLLFNLQYAVALGEYVEKEKIANLKVWTSELKRTKATARHVDAPVENWKALNEIDAVRQRFYIIYNYILI